MEYFRVMIKSKALEVNPASYYVDVAVDSKYSVLEEVFSRYQGLLDGLSRGKHAGILSSFRFVVYGLRYFPVDYLGTIGE